MTVPIVLVLAGEPRISATPDTAIDIVRFLLEDDPQAEAFSVLPDPGKPDLVDVRVVWRNGETTSRAVPLSGEDEKAIVERFASALESMRDEVTEQ